MSMRAEYAVRQAQKDVQKHWKKQHKDELFLLDVMGEDPKEVPTVWLEHAWRMHNSRYPDCPHRFPQSIYGL